MDNFNALLMNTVALAGKRVLSCSFALINALCLQRYIVNDLDTDIYDLIDWEVN